MSTRNYGKTLIGHASSFFMFLDKYQNTFQTFLDCALRLSVFQNVSKENPSMSRKFQFTTVQHSISFPVVSIWEKIQIYFKYRINNSRTFFQNTKPSSTIQIRDNIKLANTMICSIISNLSKMHFFTVCSCSSLESDKPILLQLH